VPERGGVKRCQCRFKAIENAKLAELHKNWPEYGSADFTQYEPRTETQRTAAALIRGNPMGSFYLYGNYGAGKTHLLLAQYRAMCLADIPCQLRTARQLITQLTQAELPKERDRETYTCRVIQMVQDANQAHLFIDDIDKAAARTDFRAEVLFDLLDTIKRRQLGISITGNLPMIDRNGGKDLRQVLTNQVVSRLFKLCTEVPV